MRIDLDLETFSSVDIKYGVYRYTDSPDFDILFLSYSIDLGDIHTIDLTIEEFPQELKDWIINQKADFWAWNNAFERICLSRYFNKYQWIDEEFISPRGWYDVMVHAQELGLPASLGQCARYLNIEQQKDTRGTQLINYFSKPCKPTKANAHRTRNMPEDAPDKWKLYGEYNAQDVRTQVDISKKLNRFPVADSEWELYTLDQQINDRGTKIDHELATAAIAIMADLTEENAAKMKALTGLDNPNSLKQFKGWLAAKGTPFESLGKELVEKALTLGELPDHVEEALRLRLSMSNSSTKKYLMMDKARCSDGRIHGILQFYGANRTGRWAGRLLQVQNLPRNYLDDIDYAKQLVKDKDTEAIELFYDSIPDTLKQLIRTGLIAKNGCRFVVSDFSAIEARVIAWYAGEDWVLDVFRTHGKIYEATAAQMFHLGPVEDYGWKSPEGKNMRQRGKVATLALGYQGGVGALKAMGALDQGIPENELQDIVDLWRQANKKIVKLWYDIQRSVRDCLISGSIKKGPRGLKFYKKGGFLFIQLPSGRKLAYAKAHVAEGKFGPAIFYEGQGDKVMFTKQQTYGGKLVENIVQATARDVLAEAMLRLDREGYPIVFHVHDEVVAEVPDGEKSIEEMNQLMAVNPDWSDGLPLSAEGFETRYYMKD